MSAAVATDSAYTMLSKMLYKQITSINKATAYLNKIKDSIATNDIDTLKSLIKHNEIPLKQIEDQEKSRFELIKQYGFDVSKEGFDQCIASFDDSEKTLHTLQEQLNAALNELQSATTVSDLLISKNKQRVKQSLSILTGTSLQKDHTYSSAGDKPKENLTRSIAVA